MSELRTAPGFEAALTQASAELRLPVYYRDCVRPLFNMPVTQWPRCCGRGCEPCADQLVDVARRVTELLTSGLVTAAAAGSGSEAPAGPATQAPRLPASGLVTAAAAEPG